MADYLGDMVVRILGDSKSLDKTLDKSEKGLKGLGTTGTKTSKTLAKAGTLIQTAFVAAIVVGVAKIGKELISAASDAEETRNKFAVTFSGIMGSADDAAENLAENFGLSQTAAEDLLSTTGDLLSGFGFTQTAALDLATQTNELAADLASFANVPVKQASDAITKGLLGERESMKLLGIAILDADIKQLAEDKGIVGELTRQQKAMLTLEIATTQSKNAIGDFARSQDSFANQSKIAQSAVEDFKVELGKGLLPAATNIVTVFGKIVRSLADTQAEFNNLKDIINEFEDTGKITGGLDDLIAKRDLLIKKQQEYGREASLVFNEELAALGDLIVIAEHRDAANRRANGARQRGEFEAAEAAEAEAERFAEEQVRAEQRLADIEFRDAAWGKTEEARIFAIEAEIAELETFKESDVRAQEALAYLREELAGLTEDTEDGTTTVGVWGDAAQDAYNKYKSGLQTAKLSVEELAAIQAEEHQKELDRIEAEKDAKVNTAKAIYSSLQGFTASYYDYKLSQYDSDSDEYKALQEKQFNINKSFSAINTGIAGAEAAIQANKSLAGIPIVGPALGIAAAVAIGAMTAAQVGFILAQSPPSFAEGGIVMPSPGGTIAQVAEAGQPEVIFPLDKLQSLLNTGGGGGGGNQQFHLYIDGSEITTRVVKNINNGIGGALRI